MSSGRHVLIIDDYPDSARLVELILNRLRDDIIKIALDVEIGLRLAEQDLPDLIVVRLVMADIDGYEVCRRLKAKPALRDIPVIFQSALDPKEVYAKAQKAGAVGYLYQPLNPDDVVAARDAALRGETYYPPPGD